LVELVERTDGPVTLAQIASEIPGFAHDEPGRTVYELGRECVIWDRMTKAGAMALRDVFRKRKVAIQFVNPVIYIVEDCVSNDENWRPIELLPKTAANMDTPNGLMRTSQGAHEYCIERAAKEGRSDYQTLTPRPLRFTADRFATA
jgi:hypothetical protein